MHTEAAARTRCLLATAARAGCRACSQRGSLRCHSSSSTAEAGASVSAELKRVLKFVCPGVKASLDWLGSRTVAAHPAFVPPYTKHSSGQQLNHAAYVEKCVTYRERIHSSVHGLRRALMDRPGDVSVQRDAAVVTRHDVTVPWLVEDRFQAWPDSRSEQHGSVELEWVLPPSVAETGYRPPHVVLFLHGGGYVVGSPEMYRNLTAELAIATNAAVCVPRYRLAPSHPFPAALEDALAAYWTIMAHGTTPSQLAIAGDSAGGNLVASLLLALGAGDAAPKPAAAAVALLSPWLDLAAQGSSVAANAHVEPVLPQHLVAAAGLAPTPWRGDPALSWQAMEHPLMSPVRAPRERIEAACMPPTLTQVGSTEVLLSDATSWHASICEASKGRSVRHKLEVQEMMPHVAAMWTIAGIPEARQAVESIARWFTKHWNV